MPFSKTSLKSDIKAKLLALRNNEDDADAAADELAGVIADNIASQLESMFSDATIVNVPVLVAPPGGGPVTGTITTTITITVV